ncbi:unnamed protein product [Clonostachys chloroleuca]|uniref:Uncharacterized protein n=1 Tax=Clonostachys chloroleuca TaxID=1926264 RepID=A0AA35LV39_9HYPO|nr:unnamed protein product [Clonostachys chloroleuca]
MASRQSKTKVYKAAQAPELEHAKSISQSFESFQQSQLSATTSINYVHYQSEEEPQELMLRSRADITRLVILTSQRGWIDSIPGPDVSANNSIEVFFIYKDLVANPLMPAEQEKLQISAPSFEALATRLTLPSAFIFALSRHYLPNGRGFRQLKIDNDASPVYDCWYFIPVRVQMEPQAGIAEDERGAGQMNPFHKLHLPNARRNIFRSCIGVFTRVDPASKKVTVVTFDFMHGRWCKVAQEPQTRIAEVMKHQKSTDETSTRHCNGAFIHLVYISSSVRWWTNSLNSVNEQLIAYEMKLQSELDAAGVTPEATLTKLSRALHSISAHLHRYLSELKSLHGIVTDLIDFYDSMYSDKAGEDEDEALEKANRGFNQVLSQIEASLDFATELEKKTQNILDLLFNRIQINSDRLLVANGRAMEEILRAMRADTEVGRKMADASHQLAVEMKRDSIAMRTIAIITMAFLPAATFATVLSMPFFSDNPWLKEADRFWVWILLTVPATGGCFLFYRLWRKNSQRKVADEEEATSGGT